MILLQIMGGGVRWELYQDDITLNHEGEGCSESYTRMILLQIMRQRSEMRAIPGWYYSKSWRRGVWWELHQEDITPNHEREGCRESYARMILLQSIMVRVAGELYQDDINPSHGGDGCGESYIRMILIQVMGETVVVRVKPGWIYSNSWGR